MAGLSGRHLRVAPVHCMLAVVAISTDVEVQMILSSSLPIHLLHWTARTLSRLTLVIHRNLRCGCILVCGKEGIKH